jgi:hypothetical protein
VTGSARRRKKERKKRERERRKKHEPYGGVSRKTEPWLSEKKEKGGL